MLSRTPVEMSGYLVLCGAWGNTHKATLDGLTVCTKKMRVYTSEDPGKIKVLHLSFFVVFPLFKVSCRLSIMRLLYGSACVIPTSYHSWASPLILLGLFLIGWSVAIYRHLQGIAQIAIDSASCVSYSLQKRGPRVLIRSPVM
jgi:hypothetical protein